MARYRSLPELADELLRAADAGKRPSLTKETTYVVAVALRAFATYPTREQVVRAVCASGQRCKDTSICFGCIGKANLIMRLYEGRADPFDEA